MKDFTNPPFIIRAIQLNYRSRYLGLYFWSIPARAKQTARRILIGDLIATLGVFITLIVAICLKLNWIDVDALRDQSNIRLISLLTLVVLSAILGFIIHRYLKKNLNEDQLIKNLKIEQHSKRAALPHFLLVIFGPLLYLICYAVLLKLLTYFVK